jgi:hypothetical protein
MLAGMTKGGMPNVMSERTCFNQVAIEPKTDADGRGELKHFDTVRQSLSKIIIVLYREELRLVAQAAKRRRPENPISVALVLPAEGIRFFRVLSLRWTRCPGG